MPTSQILENSSLVVQGEIVSTTCIKHDEKIYTKNVLLIEQVLSENNAPKEVTILTRGGEMDGISQFQSHGFSLRKGDKGFFFLKEKQSSWQGAYYEVYAGRQGFYKKNHDGFMTSLNSSMKSYPSFNSFCKNFGFEFDEVEFEEEMRAMDNPDACLRYRLEPIEITDISGSNQIAFNMYVRSTETVSLRELSIQLNYSNNWFGQNIVANNKLTLSDGDFDESYTLQSSDVSSDVVLVKLSSNSPIDQLQLLSGSEIKVATVSIEFTEVESELPILLENTVYGSRYYDEDENLVRNSCGHVEFSDGDCQPDITNIDLSRAAGNQSILTISGSGFIHPNAKPEDKVCGIIPSDQHRVKFESFSGQVAPLEGDYISWTANEIKVKVPTEGYIDNSTVRTAFLADEYAVTGKVTVCINDIPLFKCWCLDISGDGDNEDKGQLYVPYSTFTRDNSNDNDFNSSDCLSADHVRLTSGELTKDVLFYLDNFPSTAAEASFLRALNTWRCATKINFEISNTLTTESVPVSFGTVNLAGKIALTDVERFTCPIDNQKFLVPQQMVFSSAESWYFDESLPVDSDKKDFQSAALHEIGHAMGLIHTANMDNVMFPDAINSGVDKRSLHNDDIRGGGFCKLKSTKIVPLPPPSNPELFCGLSLSTWPGTCQTNSVNETDKISHLKLFPNPVSNVLNVSLITKFSENDLKIYNISGKIVLTAKNVQKEMILDTSSFVAGVYFLEIMYDDKVVIEKFIKS